MKYSIIDMTLREAPAEIESSNIQNSVTWKGNYTVEDAVVASQGHRDSLKQVGGIKFRGVNNHLASFGYYHT